MMAKTRNDRYQKHPLPDDFPISTLGSYREKMVAPDGPFDAAGSWTQQFGIHSTGSGSSRAGTLVLSRRVRADGGVSIHVRHEKLHSGAVSANRFGRGQPRRVLEAVLQLPAEPTRLSSPRQWSFQTQVFDEQGEAISDAGLKRRAAVRDGKLQIATGTGPTRSYPLVGEYSVHWALFDAVSRLPRESFEPIRFTLVDHFDQIKPEQTLVFRRAIDSSIQDKTVRLYGFDHTGRGIMPFTYWVDDQGRAVLVQSGLETYMLEQARLTSPPA